VPFAPGVERNRKLREELDEVREWKPGTWVLGPTGGFQGSSGGTERAVRMLGFQVLGWVWSLGAREPSPRNHLGGLRHGSVPVAWSPRAQAEVLYRAEVVRSFRTRRSEMAFLSLCLLSLWISGLPPEDGCGYCLGCLINFLELIISKRSIVALAIFIAGSPSAAFVPNKFDTVFYKALKCLKLLVPGDFR
jgi:hypothetical protein